MIVTPFTELEAVNEMLASIGELPVNTLDEETNLDVANACRILKTITRAVLSMGWTANTFPMTLLPDKGSQKIRWNANYLHILSNEGNAYIKRGEYLYDMANQTAIFTKPIEVTIVLQENFADIPDALRAYITAKATRQFQGRYLATEEISNQSQQNEAEAWKNLQEYEMTVNRFNLLQNADLQTALHRRI